MNKLDHYFEQAKELTGERKAALEDFLEGFFAPDDWKLSPEQEAELADRLADPNPDYREMTVTEAMFGTAKV